jgi:hypothetical protein
MESTSRVMKCVFQKLEARDCRLDARLECVKGQRDDEDECENQCDASPCRESHLHHPLLVIGYE